MFMGAMQIVLAVVLGAAGTIKLVRSKAQLAGNPHMGWMRLVPEPLIKLLGLTEVLGAIGLIVPAATGIAPLLTPAAAACLAALMGGAAATHAMRGESATDLLRLHDAAGRIIWASRSLERLGGHVSTVFENIHPDDLDASQRWWLDAATLLRHAPSFRHCGGAQEPSASAEDAGSQRDPTPRSTGTALAVALRVTLSAHADQRPR